MSRPQDDELLADWHTYSSRVSAGVNFEVNWKELDANSRVETLGLEAWAILQDIFDTHKLPLGPVITLWASFYVLFLGKELDIAGMVSQSTLYNNIYRCHLIDRVLESEDFGPWITQQTPHGFMRLFYSSSDDSEFFNLN